MKVSVNGREVETTAIDFVSVNEPFVEYHLANGDVIRCKFVMTRILATGERGPNGEPIYSFQFQAVAVVDEKQRSDGSVN